MTTLELMNNPTNSSASTCPPSCRVALKEWSATCRALDVGRQIILLRKGGILDADGVFELEQPQFWLLPTWFHQDTALLQNSDRHFLDSPQNQDKTLHLQWLAQVARVWAIDDADDERALQVLASLPHIWSERYLQTRVRYKPDHPLLCVALRLWKVPQAHVVESHPSYFGCRSWIELDEDLPLNDLRPAMEDEEFAIQVGQLDAALQAVARGTKSQMLA